MLPRSWALPSWSSVTGLRRSGVGAWLRTWPVTEIGLGLFTTGLFRYVGQRDVDEERLRRISEVIAGDPAARPDGLVALVSPETRDRSVENYPRLQLGDAVANHPIRRQQDFRMQDARTYSGTAPDKEPPLGNGKLLAGQSARGWQTFDVPKAAAWTQIQHAPSEAHGSVIPAWTP